MQASQQTSELSARAPAAAAAPGGKGALQPAPGGKGAFAPFSLIWTAGGVKLENERVVIDFAEPFAAGRPLAVREIRVAPEERGRGLGRAVATLFLHEACVQRAPRRALRLRPATLILRAHSSIPNQRYAKRITLDYTRATPSTVALLESIRRDEMTSLHGFASTPVACALPVHVTWGPTGVRVDGSDIHIDFAKPLTASDRAVQVESIHVPQELRGKGYGRDFARLFLAQAQARGLTVVFSDAVKPFFEKLVRYPPREPAPTPTLTLPPPPARRAAARAAGGPGEPRLRRARRARAPLHVKAAAPRAPFARGGPRPPARAARRRPRRRGPPPLRDKFSPARSPAAASRARARAPRRPLRAQPRPARSRARPAEGRAQHGRNLARKVCIARLV